MPVSPTALVAATVFMAAALPVQAGEPTLSLSAKSSTSVAPGQTVIVEAVFGKLLQASRTQIEQPEPSEASGWESWLVSYDLTAREFISAVRMDVAASSGVTRSFALAKPMGTPGTLFEQASSFSFVFDRPGSYTLTVTGEWFSWIYNRGTQSHRYRSCSPSAGDAFVCTAWGPPVASGFLDTNNGGHLGPASLQVQVVPEPASAALWLAGLVALGGWARGRAGRTGARAGRSCEINPR